MEKYITLFFLLPLTWVVYQTCLNPISKFPGPFWAKINPLWHLYQYLTGDRHKRFTQLHNKYGDIIRVGINDLSVCNVEAQKEIYGYSSNFVKSARYKILPQELKYPTILSETNPVIHSLLKKQMSSAFSMKALDSMEEYIKKNINEFCDGIRKSGNNGQFALDMSKWTYLLAFDIVGELCFGKSFGLLKDGTMKPLLTCIQRNIYFGGIIIACPELLPFLRFSPKHLKKALMQLNQQSLDKINERIENQSDRKDFFHYLTDSERLKTSLQDSCKRLHSTCELLIVAGGDTISTILNGAIYLLTTHPNVLKTLYRELIEQFPDPNRDIKHKKTVNLKYLNAVIEEVMRVYPAVLGPMYRVSAQKNFIAGQEIPPNCGISIAAYAISRDPRYFTNPESFIPERWIDSKFERDQTLGKLAFQPFSLGPTACLGRNLAYMEMRLFLAQFVLQFRPELDNPEFRYENQDRAFALKPPLFIRCHALKGTFE